MTGTSVAHGDMTPTCLEEEGEGEGPSGRSQLLSVQGVQEVAVEEGSFPSTRRGASKTRLESPLAGLCEVVIWGYLVQDNRTNIIQFQSLSSSLGLKTCLVCSCSRTLVYVAILNTHVANAVL